MKKYILIIISLLQFFNSNAQELKQFYSKEFNWRIDVPDGFNTVNSQELNKLQSNGLDAIEKTYDGKVENNTKTLFAFRSDKFNYFEANYQPFDTKTDGDYVKSFNEVNKIIYNTFKTQIPDVVIDSATTSEEINHLLFYVFKIKITFPNKIIMYGEMYSRLFENQEFSVNIMYIDEKKGTQMKETWKKSRFL